jgi:hypothetical protein
LGEKKQELLQGLVRKKQRATENKTVLGVGVFNKFYKNKLFVKKNAYICRQNNKVKKSNEWHWN